MTCRTRCSGRSPNVNRSLTVVLVVVALVVVVNVLAGVVFVVVALVLVVNMPGFITVVFVVVTLVLVVNVLVGVMLVPITFMRLMGMCSHFLSSGLFHLLRQFEAFRCRRLHKTYSFSELKLMLHVLTHKAVILSAIPAQQDHSAEFLFNQMR